MFKCLYCLTELEDDSTFCSNCGVRLHQQGKNSLISQNELVDIKVQNLSLSNLTTRSLLYYGISFILDIITIEIMLMFLLPNGYVVINTFVFYPGYIFWLSVVFGFIIPSLQIVIFRKLFSFEFAKKHILTYIFIPTFHLFLIILVTLSPVKTIELYALNNLIVFELFIGLFHFSYRFKDYLSLDNDPRLKPVYRPNSDFKNEMTDQEKALVEDRELALDAIQYKRMF